MSGGVWSATGHRPDKCGGYDDKTFALLVATARMGITWAQPTLILSGMALGWDTAVAVASVELGVPLRACVPFQGQESRWRPEQQKLYHDLLALAESVVYVCDPPYAAYKMEVRNRYMVDNSENVMALYDGSPSGGTANCVKYALSRRHTVSWWDRFIELKNGTLDVRQWQSPTYRVVQ